MQHDTHRTWLLRRLQGQQQGDVVLKSVAEFRLWGSWESQGWVSQRAESQTEAVRVSVYKKAFKHCTLPTLLSAFRALLHSGFSVTETSRRQLLMFSSICVNNITCWWHVTCWSPMGHYTFGVLNGIFQVNTSMLQLGLQQNQTPVTTMSSAKTCCVFIVALTKSQYLFLLLFLVIQSKGSRIRSLSTIFSVDTFY